ncbi:sensor histidine kinase [Clostridium butyricum]|uniref:histidine kinase n=1 Tax=Clostridium butyricum E4 str. BoNT E BL5262 TaxID=632245 RepID=C4ID01_CLOBU|nr:HAMP domain-containing sensor histidine kinase [Clostridium butyricum]EDT75543.1 putative Two-component sensor kinase CzcS [Clostridium butyricum 5521]EEP55906.1 integral membrane sensor signal transduction histidine kinase [Clostridium butyricum E4 str. BoNT E BL5262]NFL31326.1 HAMP domain-containing histidine kinase [Clostridium butyricum]NFS18353.1 HAMP domain-containing histidine kinase [Clostridium butyricum]
MIKIKSLQMKLMLIVSSILIFSGVIITGFSIYNANNGFSQMSYIAEDTTIGIISSKDSNGLDYIPALPVQDAKVIKEQFTCSSIFYLFIIIILGIVIAFIAISKAFKPMKELNKSIMHVDAYNLSMRVNECGNDDEISQLARAFNNMLERLEDVFHMQKNFASSAAHELKTPIAVMKASLQVLGLDEKPKLEDYKENKEVIEQQVEKLRLIVDDLFNLTSGMDIQFKEEIYLKAALDDIKQEFINLGITNDVELILQIGDIVLYGSHNLVYRALFNLIENAIKYNKIGGNITIYTVVNGELEIHIKDTGTGISKEALDNIYTPFYRGNDTRGLCKNGVGLGLSIVKNIIDKHKWIINVDSKLDVGTEFVIKVPKQDFKNLI